MCGIAGAIGVDNAAEAIRMMLHALQHRGSQAAGIISMENMRTHEHHGLGTVANDIPPSIMDSLTGNQAIGHNRYATANNSAGPRNIQPLMTYVDYVPIAVAHNGNFTNVDEVHATHLKGLNLNTQSDTELFFRLALRYYREHSLETSVRMALAKMVGSCSGIIMLPEKMLAIRDSSGNRPLFWGRMQGGFVVASETCALVAVGVYKWHEVTQGTMLTFNAGEVEPLVSQLDSGNSHLCIMEESYFADPTGPVYGDMLVSTMRKAFGRRLALEHPPVADLIVGIPDSGSFAAVGYAESNPRAYDQSAIIRRHVTGGRSFTKATSIEQEAAVRAKFGFALELLVGRTVELVDDSIVRGRTSRIITGILRECGAKEIHWRSAAPLIKGPCHYGIATKKGELLANTHTPEQMAELIGADSVAFISLEGFKTVAETYGPPRDEWCFACMDGKYWHFN